MKYKRKNQFSRLKKSYKKQIVNRIIYLTKEDILDISLRVDKLTESDEILKESQNPNDSIINRSI